MKQILPLRFGILYTIYQNKNINPVELMATLSPYYGKERQFTIKEIENHLDALRAAGLREESTSLLDQNGSLIKHYKITEQGMGRLRFLPNSF